MRLTEFLDADEQAANGASGSQNIEPRWEGISTHDGEGPFDKLDQAADWDDIFVYGANYTRLDRAPDSQTSAAYRRPGAESDYSIKILKDNPHVAVVHSDACGLPTGAGQKLTKSRICAIWYHSGDERAAAAAMLAGTASYLPPHIQAAVRGPDHHSKPAPTAEPEKPEKKSASTLLVELALDRYTFGCTEDGQPFAVKPGGHVVRMLRGGKNSLRAELSQAYYWRYHKAAPQQALADALLVLEGEALARNPSEVHLRVAAADNAIWLDLGDTAETVIRIDGDGWETRNTAPVLFRRTSLTSILPTPDDQLRVMRVMRVTNPDHLRTTTDKLWQHANVAEPDRPLVLACLVAAIVNPNMPHPILSLSGEQGTAKSTTTKRIVELLDPSPVPLRKPPKDPESWVTAAQGSWVVALDNMSTVPDWLSDCLCRAVTGDGDVRRALYTDSELSVFGFRRCIILNGIDLGALRGDLVDRLVHVSLDVIPEDKRVREEVLDEQWRQDHPVILGALLASVAGVIRAIPSVRLAKKPRMADFAHILAAVDQIFGTNGLTRYAEQARAMVLDTLTADPFLASLMAEKLEFTGPSAELLDRLAREKPVRDWPKNPRAVTTILRRNAPALRKAGWVVKESEDSHTKVIEWTLTHPEKARNRDPQDPQDPQNGDVLLEVTT